MTFQDGIDHPLYRFVKQTRSDVSGLWGIFYPRTDDDFNRDEWNKKKELYAERDRELERQRLNKCLSAEQRDVEIRKILSQLTLNDNDYRYLLGRGVPVSVIENCRSVTQWQELSDPVHVNLPGVSRYGNKLNNPENSILIAVPNGQGYFASMRLHNRGSESRKYTWLSSRKRGVTTNLPNGEHPIGYHSPQTIKDGSRIGLCEGMEWKSATAAINLGFPVIGFSGCNFYNAMEQVNAIADGKTFVIVPDAGTFKNKNVLRSLITSFSKFRTAGYKIEIAWWGQFDKKDGDIDEIDVVEKPIEFISVEHFLKLANGKDVKSETGLQSFIALTSKLFGGKTTLARNAKKIATGLIKTTVNQFYKAGGGAKLYEQAARSGKKFILDLTQTGLGKSFNVSQLDKNAMFLIPDSEEEILTRLFYCPPSYRNPTNAKIEEDWYETPARNNGYFINYGKHTELGNPYRESLKGLGEIDDHERTQSNCHKADIFHQHYAAGRSTEGLCKSCDLRDKCAVKKGEGYGYISEVKKWIAEGKIRTSAQWLDKDKVNICQTGVIFDEAGQVPWLRTITVKIEYLYRLMDKIRRADKQLHKRLIDIQYAISDLVDSEDYPKYGYDTKALFDVLKLDKALTADLEKVLEIELDGRKPEDNEENEIDPIFLYDLIRLMLGQTQGSVNLTRNNLTISVPNDRLRQAVHAAKFVICQDATWSASHMAMALGIKESDIYVVCQEQVIPTNLVIEHWKGIGNLGNNRSEKCKELVRVIRAQLLEKFPELGVIEWKAHAHASDLIHCGDSRGSNAYKEKMVVASIGLSRPNMTAIRLEYETLSGHIIDSFDDESFREYYGHAIAANLIQEIGRLRANRRLNEDLKFILIGDGDIKFLEDLGFDVVECDASTKLDGLDVGQAGARARYLNMGMRLCRLLGEQAWRELTLKKAAEHLERASSSVSRFVRRWFGVEGDNQGIAFKRFKEMVYAAIYGEPSSGFTEEQEINIECIGLMLQKVKYCGAELGQELKNLIEICTWDVFIESVKRLDNDYGIKLIASIFNVALQT